MDKVLGPTWTPPSTSPAERIAAAAEHHVEDIHGGVESGTSAAAATLFDCLFTAFVVDRSFFRVGENLGTGNKHEKIELKNILVPMSSSLDGTLTYFSKEHNI